MDELDRHIITALRRNSRSSYSEIGDAIGLSSSAIKRRIDRLVERGIIRRFSVEVDPSVDDNSVEAYVELHCRGTVSPAELKRILQQIPEVVEAGTVSGDADALVHMRARDIQALEQAIERIRLAPNVDFTKSSIVLSPLVGRELS